MKSSADDRQRHWLYVGSIFVAYLGLRLIALLGARRLEDNDSGSYLDQIEAISSLDLQRIVAEFGPDATPFYPVLSAIFGAGPWSTEFGARLCSLFFSIILFWAVYSLARSMFEGRAVYVALLLVTLSPPLIYLSKSVLTEPSYIGTVYLGIAVFWAQKDDATALSASVLGVLFAMTFLNRLEGILFLVLIPALQLLRWWLKGETYVPWRRRFAWLGTFVLVFGLCVTPQILRVSEQMGEPALNGRQAWSMLLHSMGDEPYEAKIYGLDFSARTINIEVVKRSPEVRATLSGGSIPFREYMGNAVRNVEELYERQLGVVVGVLAIVFFSIGLYTLLASGQAFGAILAVIFVGAGLLAPVLHNVIMRHIAVVIPMILLIAGGGIAFAAEKLSRVLEHDRLGSGVLTAVLTAAVVGGDAPSLSRNLRADALDRWSNRAYAPDEYDEILRALETRKSTGPADRKPRVAARKNYFPYMAGMRKVALPFTDYEGLVRYCRLNRVEYLFLDYGRLSGLFPFMDRFEQGNVGEEFELIERSKGQYGETLELYHVLHGTGREQTGQ